MVSQFEPERSSSRRGRQSDERSRRREERNRKAQQQLAQYGGVGAAIARQLANQQQSVQQGVVNPAIPQAQQQAFANSQSAQQNVKLPFGVEVPVGSETGAQENRGNPEFGSGFGSGVAESIAGKGLAAIGELQKGIETIGGSATSAATAFIPGDQFGFEGNLAAEREARGLKSVVPGFLKGIAPLRAIDTLVSGNPAGEAQALAEAFRITDMPSFMLDIVPGKGINLPGDNYFNEVQIGLKGAIELLPDALLTVATGGVSLAATGSRFGLARALPKAAAQLAYKTVGGDIAVGAGKQIGRVITKAPEITKLADPVRKSITNLNWENGAAGIDRLSIPAVKDAINRLPTALKGSMSGLMSKVNPSMLLDNGKDKLARAIYGRMNGYSLIPGGVEANLAVLAEKQGGIRNLPTLVTAESLIGAGTGLDVGRRVGESVIGRTVGKFRDMIVDRVEQTPVMFLDKEGRLVSNIEELDGRAWVDAAQSFFKGDFNTIRKGGDAVLKGTGSYVPVDVNGQIIRSVTVPGEIPVGGGVSAPFSHWAVNAENLLEETNGTKIATFFRHYLETIDDMTVHYEMNTEKVVVKTVKSRFEDGFYAPQVPNGGSYFDEVASFFPNSGGKIRPFKERSLFGEGLQERIDAGDIAYAGPIESLQSHMTNMYAATIDAGMAKEIKLLAADKLNGILDIGEIHRQGQSAVTRLINNPTGTTGPKNIAKMKANGLGVLAEELTQINAIPEKNVAARVAAIKRLQKAFDGDIVVIGKQYHKVPTSGAKKAPAFAGLMFSDKKQAELIAEASDLIGETTAQGVTKFFAEAGDTLRVGKTGFDFGFHLIHGLPMLGLAQGRLMAGHPKEAFNLYKLWGKSLFTTADAFFRPEVLMQTLMKDPALVQEAVEKGLQISRTAQDYFIAIQNGSILKRLPKIGESTDQYLSELASSFERAFVAPGDLLRIEGYRIMRNTAGQTENGLAELAATLNKMTGSLSSSASGISRGQQQIERGFLFFSPRYTRAAMALISDVYRGGTSGELARQSLAGMAFLGAAGYIAFAKALNQEPVLDPTDSRFMTMQFGEDRVGIGGFYTQFIRLAARVASTSYDSNAQEAFGDWKDNPLVRWTRSRAAPGAGTAWDIATGEDFMGRTIEPGTDWFIHAARQTAPTWLEAGLLDSPYRVGVAGLAAEVGGGRVRPLSASERRRDMRDSLAVNAYGKKWEDLNGLQRREIDSGKAPGMTGGESENIAELSELVRSQRADVGEEQEKNIEKWYHKRSEIDEEWAKNIGVGTDYLSVEGGGVDLEFFRTFYLKNSNAIRRTKMEALNDIDGEFALTMQYFDDSAKAFGNDHAEDVAYDEYIDSIISTDAFDDPRGFNFRKRDEAVLAFKGKWGDDVYAYVQQIFATGRDIPPIVNEFWKGRGKFEYYWGGIADAALERMPRAGEVKLTYQLWLESDDLDKANLEKNDRLLKKYLKTMDDARVELRKKDPKLDSWLFRWGYTGSMSARENRVAPDGFSDAERFWRQPEDMPLSQFGIVEGINIPGDAGSLQPSL
jgi:hypothetical protein